MLRRPREGSEREVETLTEAMMIDAVRKMARAPKRRIRWMIDRKGHERWGYEGEPLPAGWKHLCWQDER